MNYILARLGERSTILSVAGGIGAGIASTVAYIQGAITLPVYTSALSGAIAMALSGFAMPEGTTTTTTTGQSAERVAPSAQEKTP